LIIDRRNCGRQESFGLRTRRSAVRLCPGAPSNSLSSVDCTPLIRGHRQPGAAFPDQTAEAPLVGCTLSVRRSRRGARPLASIRDVGVTREHGADAHITSSPAPDSANSVTNVWRFRESGNGGNRSPQALFNAAIDGREANPARTSCRGGIQAKIPTTSPIQPFASHSY
jgi:hypothetical protein